MAGRGMRCQGVVVVPQAVLIPRNSVQDMAGLHETVRHFSCEFGRVRGVWRGGVSVECGRRRRVNPGGESGRVFLARHAETSL